MPPGATGETTCEARGWRGLDQGAVRGGPGAVALEPVDRGMAGVSVAFPVFCGVGMGWACSFRLILLFVWACEYELKDERSWTLVSVDSCLTIVATSVRIPINGASRKRIFETVYAAPPQIPVVTPSEYPEKSMISMFTYFFWVGLYS